MYAIWCLFSDDRRSYPDEPPPPPSVPQRAEKKPETKNVDDLLKPPGRVNRPDRVKHLTVIKL